MRRFNLKPSYFDHEIKKVEMFGTQSSALFPRKDNHT